MRVLIVYCHPSNNSFTHIVKESFIKGLEDAGYSYEVSDLYAEGFNPVMSEGEYIREGFYKQEEPVAEDVLHEQQKINRADVIVFIYPDFWTASPAMLEGWFQRVWTYGFAYGDKPSMKCLEKAMFLVTMGGSLNDDIRRVQLEAMKTVMVGDRIKNRAKTCEVYAFDQMTRGYGNDENREKRIVEFSRKAYDLAKTIGQKRLVETERLIEKEKLIKTERLILRKWTVQDAESLFMNAKDQEVGPIAGWPPHQDIEESREVISNVLNGKECYAICEKENNTAIGAIELKLNGYNDITEHDDECEMGFWLGKPFWGKGYMPEAAKALLKRGFEELGMTTIWCAYYDRNEKSKKAQQKMGFVYHHTIKDAPVPLLNETRTCHVNAMTKEQWEKN